MNVGLLVAFLLNVKKALSHLVFYPEFPNDLANLFNLPLCSSHFPFLVFGHFWRQSNENTKILRNLCLHFARQDGQDRKKWKENHATKVTKIPKTKRRKYGMNETFT